MKKTILIGKSCSGKTELSLHLQENGYRTAVACTTRPKRYNETDGVHYYFKTSSEFLNMLANDEFLNTGFFNSWYYGMTKSEFENSDVVVVTPDFLNEIIHKYGRDSINIVFIDTSTQLRIKRSQKRKDDPAEVIRRLGTDEDDFRQFIANEDWDIRIDLRLEDKFKSITKLFSQKQELLITKDI
jgi:guanylate kinase